MAFRLQIPRTGLDREDVIQRLASAKADDVDWLNGRSWSLVYYAGEEHTAVVRDAYDLYFSENAAGPSLFPSLRRLEDELISMVLGLLNGRSAEVGNLTSGGTESILLAMKAYRDQARHRKPRLSTMEILVPESAHPAFLKAAHYLDLRVVPVPLNSDCETDLDALRQRTSPRTICMVASAPSLAHGVMDPIDEMGRIATEHGIGLHVDACLGGFLLPFMRQLAYAVPQFDFAVPGVTSISTDLHKNGYAAKGASALLYKSRELRRYQSYVNVDWPGGAYVSPTMMGTRPGGAVAAAWASIMALGQEGYVQTARRTMDAANALMEGIAALPGLFVVGKPVMSVFAFGADDIDVFALADHLDTQGWRVNRQNHPRSLHMVATANHLTAVPRFLHDLEAAVRLERKDPTVTTGKCGAFLYGGNALLEDESQPEETTLSRSNGLW
ncbi:MAG: aspartate aminotransferase family protein [Gammaproteobacteria bacterium]|jgi:glutamate/tyrosine decarboxylase-like PLP-dependent enzyme